MFISKQQILRVNKHYSKCQYPTEFGDSRMNETNVVATNADAEKLFEYLVAYKKHLNCDLSVPDTLTIEAIPIEENVSVSVES